MSAAWARAHNVLCVRLDNLGDVLMTTPALRALKEARPGRRITLLASRTGALLSRFVPEVDAAIPYAAPWMKTDDPASAAADLQMITRLRRAGFDAAVIFTVYSQSALPAALFTRLAGIPLRLAHARENPYHLLTDRLPETDPGVPVRHEVRRQLDLVAHVGARTGDERLSFRVMLGDRQRAHQRLRAAGVDVSRPWVLVHPGATAASRRYPAERFGAAARAIIGRLGCPVVVTGDAAERALTATVCREAGRGAHDFGGAFALGEFAAAVQAAGLIVSNNTGAVHIAAALGTPVVDLYALTNPQHTPWGVPSRVLSRDVPCRNCYQSVCPEGHNACLAGIEPGEVAEAAESLWNERARPGVAA